MYSVVSEVRFFRVHAFLFPPNNKSYARCENLDLLKFIFYVL